jgi:hypothetical protein
MSINRDIKINAHNLIHYRTKYDADKLTVFIKAIPDAHRRNQLHTLLAQYASAHERRKKIEAEVVPLLDLPAIPPSFPDVFKTTDLATSIFCFIEMTESNHVRATAKLMCRHFPTPLLHLRARTHLNLDQLHKYRRWTGLSHEALLHHSVNLLRLSLRNDNLREVRELRDRAVSALSDFLPLGRSQPLDALQTFIETNRHVGRFLDRDAFNNLPKMGHFPHIHPTQIGHLPCMHLLNVKINDFINRSEHLQSVKDINGILNIVAASAPSLTDIDLTGYDNQLKPEGLFALSSSIRYLNLSEIYGAHDVIAELPTQFPNLISLSLDRDPTRMPSHDRSPSTVTSETLPLLLQGLPCLKFLSLRYCRDLSLEALMSIVYGPCKLTKLDLYECNHLNDKLVTTIATAHPQLTDLNVRCDSPRASHITLTGLTTLLRTCPGLRDQHNHLDFSSAAFNREDIEDFASKYPSQAERFFGAILAQDRKMYVDRSSLVRFRMGF